MTYPLHLTEIVSNRRAATGDINQFFGWVMSRQGAPFALFVVGFPLGWVTAGYT